MVLLHPSTPNAQHKKSNRRHLRRSSGIYGILPQSPKVHYAVDAENLPLDSATNRDRFGQLSDAMEELDVNMTNLQQIHEAMSGGFNESFAAFLYGLNITTWCVDFPGCPTRDQWQRIQKLDGIDNRVALLQEQIEELRQENSRLRAKISATESNHTTTVSAGSSRNEETRLPQRGAVRKPVGRNKPNLNQPPRYMKDLFELKIPRRK
ncbi:DASH complex subunit dam1 [Naganishia cerealis]|uniref:DASH complex subunit dam1 n=1 Tax=Naganishia cerealis TaxID=610337 RepID=A0ACC2VVS3_9TREE|nr:DASH complex subunit dam1 [Naganishia cerealis]